MRLLKPSVGEVVDRLTILQLKINCAKKKEISADHFNEERLELEAYLVTAFPDIYNQVRIFEYTELNQQMLAINTRLWNLEDEIRDLHKRQNELKEEEKIRVYEIAFLIPDLNDRRADTVRKINTLIVGTEGGIEKLHS